MKTSKTVGVVVGRFQTPQLHPGHRHLIEYALERSDTVLVVVGVSPGWASGANSMDFETRALMLASAYPGAVIVPIEDQPIDERWSSALDALILKSCPKHKPILFGSRDSFLPHYCGVFETVTVPEIPSVCATDVRNGCAVEPLDSEEFRRGVIYAGTKQNFPTSFQAVDIAIRHTLEPKVLVGRKPFETLWRFPGGFVEPGDPSLERAAAREAREEAGDIEIADITYLSSFRINDYRYRKSEHKLMSALFTALYVFGPIKASDDLADVRWQTFDGLVECMVEAHKPLAKAFLESVKGHNKP